MRNRMSRLGSRAVDVMLPRVRGVSFSHVFFVAIVTVGECAELRRLLCSH